VGEATKSEERFLTAQADHSAGAEWKENASACSVRNDGAALGNQQGFGVFPGDGQEFQGGLAGAAGALFPAADGVGAYVQIGGEEGLAGVQSSSDVADFFGGNRLGARGDARDAQVDGLAALVGGGIL
jgi:hypothetical protein